jgi:hypothetical protein
MDAAQGKAWFLALEAQYHLGIAIDLFYTQAKAQTRNICMDDV